MYKKEYSILCQASCCLVGKGVSRACKNPVDTKISAMNHVRINKQIITKNKHRLQIPVCILQISYTCFSATFGTALMKCGNDF